LIVEEGMALTLIGVVAGLILAAAVCPVLSRFLFETPPTDPVTYGSVSIFLAAIALLACVLPAIRAARIDPVKALKYE